MKRISLVGLSLLLSVVFLSEEVAANTGVPENVETTVTSLKYEENSCIALNYHRVREFKLFEKTLKALSNSRELVTYSVSEDAFREHMEFLKENDATFVTMSELLEAFDSGDFPEKCIWLNFDDMDRSIYQNAYPILKEMEIPATGFVITGEVGNKNFNNLPLVNQEELLEMYDSGLWEFASHTNQMHDLKNNGNDSIMLDKSKAQIEEDMTQSLDYIEDHFEIEETVLAYPYGQANDNMIDAISEIGVDYGFTLEEDIITADSNPYYLPRILVSEAAFDTLIKDWEGFN
jgi:intercellular adhesin biosynthesis polysaccharide N-deacetylase